MLAFVYWIAGVVAVLFATFIIEDRLEYKHPKRVECALAILRWIVILSPLWYEFPSTFQSVPVTVGVDGTVYTHPLGMFAIPYVSEYTNMPTEKFGADLVATTKITGDRRVLALMCTFSGSIQDARAYYEDASFRDELSPRAEQRLQEKAIKVGIAFLQAHTISMPDSTVSVETKDSLKGVFAKWFQTNTDSALATPGIQVELTDAYITYK